MNRPDVLRKILERGVATEEEVGTVSRLLYVQMLSGLQRGQRVELGGFGSFGTRIAGVKTIKKVPYFEPSFELAERANQRFRELRSLLIGTYEQISARGDEEYLGQNGTYDPVVETLGNERVLDTQTEIGLREYEQLMADSQRPQQQEEDSVMPRLNLKDESAEEESLQDSEQAGAPPTLREVGGGGGGLSPAVLVALIVAVLGLGVFALNHFGVIHLWGKKAVKVAEAFPEPSLPEPAATTTDAGGQATPPESTPPESSTPTQSAPTPSKPAQEQTPQITPPAPTTQATKPAATAPPSGGGDYTIQVSSWASKGKADAEAARLSGGGYSAYVEQGMVGGTNWYRVRVGRYATEKEAKAAIANMQPAMETDLWVTRVGR